MMAATAPEFVIEDSFEVRGRGKVYTGRCPADWRDRSKAIGARVLVNGETLVVKALESNAKLTGPDVGDPVGLIFEDEVK
jgi:hypothetical protein